MAVRVRQVRTDTELEQCFSVRMTVFVDEQRVPPEEELDAFDATATHYLAEEDGRIVGTARLLAKDAATGKIGRVAVLREHRGRGVGLALMRFVMEDAFDQYERLMLDAQVQVIPFYERLGFAAEGPVFLDAGIDHRRMTLHRAAQAQAGADT